MADRFIIHGATFNGDGTTSAEATVDGGVGAWNTITYFEGTTPAPPGTLPAGSTVYIRSLDAAGNPLTFTLSAAKNLGSTSATSTAPITWVIDNAGETWTGITGTLKYIYHATTAYALTFLANNNFVATVADGIVAAITNTSGANVYSLHIKGNVVNLLHDVSNKTAAGGFDCPIGCYGGGRLENVHEKTYKVGTGNPSYAIFSLVTSYGEFQIVNPQVEIMNAATNGQGVFHTDNNNNGFLSVLGGTIYGNGATTGQALFMNANYNTTAASAIFRAVGLSYPNTMSMYRTGFEPICGRTLIDFVGGNGGSGAYSERAWGYVTSREDNNPPVLSSTLPDGNLTKFAWRMYPRAASFSFPAELQLLTYSQAASATRTITLEFLAESNFASVIHKGNTWMDVTYVDETDTPRHDTTRVLTTSPAVDTSTNPDWSTTSWYLSTFDKYKLSLTTANQIKQGTAVTVAFRTTMTAASAFQVLFINSEFSIV